MISFEDLIVIVYIWVPNTTMEGIIKKMQFKQHFALLLGIWPTKNMILIYWSIFSVYLSVLAPTPIQSFPI